MLRIGRPTPEQIQAFLEDQAQFDFTYKNVGATATDPPEKYTVDRRRVLLGQGERVYESAVIALRNWKQFDERWLTIFPSQAEIKTGNLVAIVAHRFHFFWWLNACRIIYTIEESSPLRRFGFAYGTLPDHIGSGEERFLVEMDEENNVWYDILAFSRPYHPFARWAYFVMRWFQRKFGDDSTAAMRRNVDVLPPVHSSHVQKLNEQAGDSKAPSISE